MDERAEITVGVVMVAVVLAIGLGAHFGLVPGAGEGAAPAEAALLPPDARREGVPDFGPPATAAELAVVAPLVVGARFDGWTVEGIDAVLDGRMVVHLLHGSSRLNLEIALAAGSAVLAPGVGGPYAVFATHLSGEDARGTVATALAESLARRLEANAGVPPPPGMRGYAPARDPAEDAPEL